MAEYEVVREVQNLCANNQMRDVFFDEIETDDPVEWIRREVKGKEVVLNRLHVGNRDTKGTKR